MARLWRSSDGFLSYDEEVEEALIQPWIPPPAEEAPAIAQAQNWAARSAEPALRAVITETYRKSSSLAGIEP